jgi:hypothetical protein
MIVVVNDEWLSFGSENVYNLSQDVVVNKSLWDFIIDKETQHLYKIMLEKVRAVNARIKFPFRCDSPDCRRFMELEIFTLNENLIEFRSRIVKLEFRPQAALLDFWVERSEEFVRICGWCKKIYVSEAKWVEVEEAVEELNLFGETKLPQLTHSICPSCKESLTQSLKMFSR